jgi:hypothetical protein
MTLILKTNYCTIVCALLSCVLIFSRPPTQQRCLAMDDLFHARAMWSSGGLDHDGQITSLFSLMVGALMRSFTLLRMFFLFAHSLPRYCAPSQYSGLCQSWSFIFPSSASSPNRTNINQDCHLLIQISADTGSSLSVTSYFFPVHWAFSASFSCS